MSRPRLGTVFLPTWAPEHLKPFALATEASGLDELWFWEDCFAEAGPASVAAALGWTEWVRVGLGLMPVPLRTVAIAALEIATIERLFPGRFSPVIGHGVQRWMGQAGVTEDRTRDNCELVLESAATIDRLAAFGVTTVLVHSVAAEPDPADYATWLGREVAPLVSA